MEVFEERSSRNDLLLLHACAYYLIHDCHIARASSKTAQYDVDER
jgi:hypothetical protein